LLLFTTQQRITLEAKNLAVSMHRWISTQIQRVRFKRGVAYGHVTQFRNFGTLITFEQTDLSAWNLVYK